MNSERFALVKKLLVEAADLSEADRAAYLNKVCGTDAGLRNEIEALLIHDATPLETLESSAVVPLQKDDPLVGITVSHYSIMERLGEGGMGLVYKAEDMTLHRTVALKFLRGDMAATQELRQRLIHEAQFAAALNHPNICTIHEIDEYNDQMFIAMAFVEGLTLKEMISSGPLDVEQVVNIARQVTEGLKAAHDKGIIHRDIKPSNIMVTPSGRATIMDFGLARSSEQSDLTKTGMVMGTASYMSPEQARGEHVDHRTDIWSLGAVLREALTGERPFKGANSESVLYSILNDEPTRITSIRTDLSEELSIIVANALEKDPDERYQSASELATDLNAVAERLSGAEKSQVLVNIPRRRRAKEAARLWRRVVASARRWWAMIPLAAAVATAVVVGVKQMIGVHPVVRFRPDRVVVARFENRTGDGNLDHLGLLTGDWIHEGISQVDLGEVVPMEIAAAFSQGPGNGSFGRQNVTDVKALAEKAEAGLVISGTYDFLRDSLLFRANLTQIPGEEVISTVTSELIAIDTQLDGIEEFRQRIMGGLAAYLSPEIVWESYLSPPRHEAYRELCTGLVLFGKDFPGASEHFERAIRIDSTFVEPYHWLASSYDGAGDWASGDEVAGALEQRRATLTPVQRCVLDYMLARYQGRQKEAWRHLMEAARLAPTSDYIKYGIIWKAPEMNRPGMAIELCEEMGGPDKFMRHGLMAYFWYANFTDALHQVGEYERELDVIREARERFPDVVHPWLVEARALAAMGRIDELNRLLQECPSTEPTWWFTVGSLLIQTARELRAHGYREAAQDIANRAVDWSRKGQFELYQGSGARSYVAQSLYVAERWEEAQEVVEELASEYPKSISYLGATGRVAARLGDRGEAQRVFDELQALDRPYLFGKHNYASAQIASILGDYEQAVVLLAKAFDQTYEYSSNVLNDPDLLLMRGYPAWEELIRPKG